MKSIKQYMHTIQEGFEQAANPKIAEGQQAYMKHRFAFYGIKSPERRLLQRPFFLRAQLPQKEYLPLVIKCLWQKPQRELQYFGQELALKYVKSLEVKDLTLFEYMITHKSRWDTVDFISSNLMGNYFKSFPDQRWPACKRWLKSDDLWLQRATLLFQLKYKRDTDTELLQYNINYLLGSEAFFINKAIGWILREYSKTNPGWVRDFVKKTDLNALSRREAIKYIQI